MRYGPTQEIIELKPDTVAWMPFGTLCIPLFLLDARTMEVKTFWVLPCLAKSLAAQVAAKARGPIDKWNLDMLQKYSGQPVFKSRMEGLQKLHAAVGTLSEAAARS